MKYVLFCLSFLLIIGCGGGNADYFKDPSPAQKAYEEAEEFAKKNKQNPEACEQKYRECVETYTFSDWGIKAKEKINKIRNQRAEVLYKIAEDFLKANPDSKEEARDKFGEVCIQFKNTAYAQMALKRIDQLKKEEFPEVVGEIILARSEENLHPLAVRAEFKGTELPPTASLLWQIEDKKVKDKESFEHVFDRPGQYAFSLKVLMKGVEIGVFVKEIALTPQLVSDILKEEQKKVHAMIFAGDLEDAQTHAKLIDSWAVKGVDFRNGSMTAETDEIIGNVSEFYRTVIALYDSKDKLFDIDKAKLYVNQFKGSKKGDIEQAVAAIELRKLNSLDTLYSKTAIAFRGKKGTSIRLKGMSVTIKSVSGQTVTVDAGYGVIKRLKIFQLTTENLQPVIEDIKAQVGKYKYGVFLESIWDFENANRNYRLSRDPQTKDTLKVLGLKQAIQAAFNVELLAAAEEEEKNEASRVGMMRDVVHLYNTHINLIEQDLKIVDLAKEWNTYLDLPPKYKADLTSFVDRMMTDTEEAKHLRRMRRYLGKGTQNSLLTLQTMFPDPELEKWLKLRERFMKKYTRAVKSMEGLFVGLEKEYKGISGWDISKNNYFMKLLEREVNRIKVVENRKGHHKLQGGFGGTKYEQLVRMTRGFLKGRGKYPVYFLYNKNLMDMNSFIYGSLGAEELYTKDKFALAHRKIFLEMFIGEAIKRGVQ